MGLRAGRKSILNKKTHFSKKQTVTHFHGSKEESQFHNDTVLKAMAWAI